MCVCMYVCERESVCVYVYVCVCERERVCVCMYVCESVCDIYIYIYIYAKIMIILFECNRIFQEVCLPTFLPACLFACLYLCYLIHFTYTDYQTITYRCYSCYTPYTDIQYLKCMVYGGPCGPNTTMITKRKETYTFSYNGMHDPSCMVCICARARVCVCDSRRQHCVSFSIHP